MGWSGVWNSIANMVPGGALAGSSALICTSSLPSRSCGSAMLRLIRSVPGTLLSPVASVAIVMPGTRQGVCASGTTIGSSTSLLAMPSPRAFTAVTR